MLMSLAVLTEPCAEVHDEVEGARRGTCAEVFPSVNGHLISLKAASAV